MRRKIWLGETWFKLKSAEGSHPEWDAYDEKFFLSEYEAVKTGNKTKDDVVRDVLQRVYETGVLREAKPSNSTIWMIIIDSVAVK